MIFENPDTGQIVFLLLNCFICIRVLMRLNGRIRIRIFPKVGSGTLYVELGTWN